MFGFLVCGPFAYLTECVKRIVGCICCIACIGPILAIVGIVLLVAPNTRKERVDRFNAVVDAFNAATGDATNIRATTGSSSGRALSVAQTTVKATGNQDDVSQEGVSVYLSSTFTVPTTGTSVTIPFSVQVGTNVARTFSYTMPASKTERETVRCDAGCTTERNRCTSDGGSAGSRYNCGSDQCFVCETEKYLGSFCGQMSFQKTRWDKVDKGCDYSFDLGVYTRTTRATSAISVILRSDEDPYISLELETKGSKDFGLTEGQQRGAGAALLIVGLIFCVCVYGGLAIGIYCVAKQSPMMNNDDTEPTQMQQVPVQGQPVQQQEYKPQPYQSEPQQQPYAAQPTAVPYGQPPPQQQGGYPQQQAGYPQQGGYPQQQQQGAYQQQPPPAAYGAPPSTGYQQQPPPPQQYPQQGGGYPQQQQNQYSVQAV